MMPSTANEDTASVSSNIGDVKADDASVSTAGGGEQQDPDRLSIDKGEAEFANTNTDNHDVMPASAPIIADANEEDNDVEEGGGQRDTVVSQEPEVVNRVLRRKCYIIITLLVIVGVLIAVVVGLVVGNKNSNGGGDDESNKSVDAPIDSQPVPDSSPNDEGVGAPSVAVAPPTPPPSTAVTTEPDPKAIRLQDALDYLTTNNVVSDVSTLDPASNLPQYQAAVWIAKEDEQHLPIPPVGWAEYQFIQRYSLAVLYYAMGGEEWLWSMDWLSGGHECNWYMSTSMGSWGTYCDGQPESFQDGPSDDLWSKQRTVTHVDFPPKNNMVGTFPPELGNLRYLKYLVVEQQPGVTGSIPDSYGDLEHLNYVTLVQTSLTGKLPRSFAKLKKLEYLSLEYNMFSGDTTKGDLDFLSEMTALKILALDYNSNITGTLPDLSSLSNLELLSVPNTGMYGTLPASLTMLTNLRLLFLDDCAFEGSMSMISSMSNLTHVYLEDNWFDDTIDDSFFANGEKLVHLDVSNCSFSGTIPKHLFNFSNLQVLDMSMNELTGELPAEAFADLQDSSLSFLSLHTNKLSGNIPASIRNLTNLATLDLSLNEFSGDIPSEIGELSNLDILFLGRNSYNEAPIPSWLRNMTTLRELSLKSSSLIETIPTWLGELTYLLFLDLGENSLTGSIPQELGNLTELTVLILNSNSLTGELGLGGLKYLEVLLIDDNSITGNTDEMCVNELVHFVSDCGGEDYLFDSVIELNCSCCTLCCYDTDTTCNDDEWLGNHEGIWEFGYERVRWDFDVGPIFPYVNYNMEQSMQDNVVELGGGSSSSLGGGEGEP